jgi:hypothetical protein
LIWRALANWPDGSAELNGKTADGILVRSRMPVIHIGTDSEYVKVSLPPSYTTEGWARAEVEISVSGFHGRIQPWVEAADFEVFTKQLRLLYDSLEGKADFAPREAQFTLTVASSSGGHIDVTVVAWSNATYGKKLEYLLEFDQSFLSSPLRELESLLTNSTNSAACHFKRRAPLYISLASPQRGDTS